MDFDEWFKKRHTKTGLYEKSMCGEDDSLYLKHEMKKAFKAGQQSKQAEIDALKEKLEQLKEHTFINYDSERDDDQHSYWSGYNVAMGEIVSIIEENNNDT